MTQPKIWEILQMELKKLSPTFFKEQIREWAPKNCPFHLCKTFVQNTGFL